MRVSPVSLPIVALVACAALPATARGTPEQAQAMFEKAAAHYKAVGRAKALADFSSGKPPFREDDLYVVCISPERKIAANGAYPKYVGMLADTLVDANGKALGSAILDTLGKQGKPSITYPMFNPTNGKQEMKTLYGRKLGEDVCGVGAFAAR